MVEVGGSNPPGPTRPQCLRVWRELQRSASARRVSARQPVAILPKNLLDSGMTKTIANYVKGITSVATVTPDLRYAKLVPQKTQEQRMREIWEMTGQQISSAVTQYEQEHTTRGG